MLPPGTRLGPYEIVDALGAGGMGHVYRARDTRLGRHVAVKVLPPEFSTRPESLARFEREGLAVASLSHPNILAIHDVGAEGSIAYAVTELLEGETLRGALLNGALPLRRATDYGVQFARGLAAAHDKGLVHRDLKPENLFITADGRLKILDFGLARHDAPATGSASIAPTLDSPTDPGTVLGTVGYMAPEQVRGAAVDYRADIFAFGCVLFELVTGRRAFQRETAAETMTAILREDPPELPPDVRIPPALDRIIRHCLEKQPEARFRSAHDLALALEAISGSSTPSATSVPALPIAKPRAWIPTLVAFALVAAGMTAAGFWYGRLRGGSPSEPPPGPATFRRVTFNSGQIDTARFASDGRTFVYSLRTNIINPRLLLARLESPVATALAGREATLYAVSSNAEVLAGLNGRGSGGLTPQTMLVRMPLFGGAPREVLDGVTFADWSPVDDAIAAVRLVGSEQRLEFPIGTVLVKSEGEIGFPRVSPQGDRVAFLDWPVKNDDRGTVVIVDRQGHRQVVSRTWDGVRSLAWSAAGDEVWYTAALSGVDYSLWASAPGRTERRIYSAPAGLVLLDIGRDGKALVGRYDREILVEGLFAGDSAPRDLSWLGLSFARDLSPDGRVLLSYAGEGSASSYDVYVRGIRDAEAVRVGEGEAQQFSPDGKSVLAVIHGPPSHLDILPIGPGDKRTVATGNVTVTQARWLPDGRRLLVVGTEPSRGMRAYIIDGGSAPRPITPEGITWRPDQIALSHDGTRVAFRAADGGVMAYSTANGDPTPVKGLAPNEVPLAWTGDDRLLLVLEGMPPRQVMGLDPVTGRRTPLKTIAPSDPSLVGPTQLMLSADGASYVANYTRRETTVFLAEGLR